jgi:hypothetical protein
MTGPVPAHRGRRDNGLDSEEFSPVADVDPRLADHLLDVLGLRDVAAYVEPAPASNPLVADRLYVAADQTGAAREVLTEIASELGIDVSRGHQHVDSPDRPDPLLGRDTDAEFAAIVAGLDDLDRPLFEPLTSAAVQAVGGGDIEDVEDEVEHFVPPPPPPIPRPAVATAMAALMTLLGILVMAFGSSIGLPADLPLPLGVVLVLFGAGMLIMRLREEPWDDSDDDGAVV